MFYKENQRIKYSRNNNSNYQNKSVINAFVIAKISAGKDSVTIILLNVQRMYFISQY